MDPNRTELGKHKRLMIPSGKRYNREYYHKNCYMPHNFF